jgi:hypothetical protein
MFARELLEFLSPDELQYLVTIVDVTEEGVPLSTL